MHLSLGMEADGVTVWITGGVAVNGALGSEERLCRLGQVLAGLREVGWEEVTVACGPQGATVLPCSWELCPGGIPSPLQREGVTRGEALPCRRATEKFLHCLRG